VIQVLFRFLLTLARVGQVGQVVLQLLRAPAARVHESLHVATKKATSWPLGSPIMFAPRFLAAHGTQSDSWTILRTQNDWETFGDLRLEGLRKSLGDSNWGRLSEDALLNFTESWLSR
jgi:hypothetical protein